MISDGNDGGDRAISLEVGVILMVVIVVVLSSLIATSLTAVVYRTEEKLERQATGSYEFEVQNDDKLHISPENLDTNNARLGLQINGNPVYEWDGQEPLEVTCLYPGDEILVTSKKDGVTSVVDEWKMVGSTKCDRLSKLTNKFRYAFIDKGGSSKKAQIAPGIPFTLSIDPDGAGTDSTSGNNVYKQNIGKVPFSNPWHYYKRFERGIGPYDEGPVWLIVMVDNVHWKEGSTNAGGVTCCNGYNWTDDPPSGLDPGENAYEIINGEVAPVNDQVSGTFKGVNLDSLQRNTEPTNDVYLLFQPRCASEAPYSTLKLFGVTAGYANDIYFNGKKVIDDTSDSDYKSSSSDVDPDVEETFKLPPRDC